jgi:hypothetical protein
VAKVQPNRSQIGENVPRTGRPSTPAEQKRRRGTFRADRNTAALTVVPKVAIERIVDGPIVQALVESGATPWIGESDTPTVRLAQRLWDDMERMRSALDVEWTPKGHAAYIATVKELRSCLSLLGLSPSDRSRLGVAEVKARSKLEELMDRRRTRTASSASSPSSNDTSESPRATTQAS